MKRINVNEVRVIPGDVFGFCVYGEPSERVFEWANSWGFRISESGDYTNILVPLNFDVTECFEKFKQFKYIDGFTHNLGKEIHIGQLFDFILTKSFLRMGVAEKSLAIIGDSKAVNKELESEKIFEFFELFSFDYDEVIYASDLKIDSNLRSEGKSNAFCKDHALLERLKAPCVHVAGYNRNHHFEGLKKEFPHILHLSAGLVHIHKKKLIRPAYHEGHASVFVENLLNEFDGNIGLAYNVIAGFILKNKVKKDKNLNIGFYFEEFSDSPGMYLSYTLARLNSIGVKSEPIEKFNRTELQFSYIKSLHNLEPSILLNSIVSHCRLINKLYAKHRIEGNLENEIMFSNLKEDLELGMKTLGMFLINKV